MDEIAQERYQLAKKEYGQLKLAQLKEIALQRYGDCTWALVYYISSKECGGHCKANYTKKPWLILLSQPLESNQAQIDNIRQWRQKLRQKYPHLYP